MKIKKMIINRETAMRLWNKSFGKSTKVNDFAGRTIVKSAYDDRSSEFGWNVDHILPQSRGGKTADYNLVCCHIATNDEKADKFPGFVANNRRFTIIKVENHYEIKAERDEVEEDTEEEWNPYDSASGIRFFKNCKGFQNQKLYVGSIDVLLYGVEGADSALIDFIEEIFDEESIAFCRTGQNFNTDCIRMTITSYDLPNRTDVEDLLDKCILLNTYLANYFMPMNVVSDYGITYRLDCYDRLEYYLNRPMQKYISLRESSSLGRKIKMKINSLVIQNTTAKKEFDIFKDWDPEHFEEYNYCYNRLADNLRKEIGE